jgi:hypothetical protein
LVEHAGGAGDDAPLAAAGVEYLIGIQVVGPDLDAGRLGIAVIQIDTQQIQIAVQLVFTAPAGLCPGATEVC